MASLIVLTRVLLLLQFFTLQAVVRAAPTAGCGKKLPENQTPGGDSQQVKFQTLDGLNRKYIIYIPAEYKNDVPSAIQFNYHGRGQTAAAHETMTGFSKPSWNKNIIQVYLQGYSSGGENSWQGDPGSDGIDDVSFTKQLLESLADKYCLDDSRILASGASNGGGFVGGQLLCSTWGSSVFAAGAPVYGAFYTQTIGSACTDGTFSPMSVPISCIAPINKRLAIFEIHGDSDGTIAYTGGSRRGKCLPDLRHWITEWSIRLGHKQSNVTEALYDGIVKRAEFGADANKGIVTHYKVKGMGHNWPKKSNFGFDATSVVLQFFNKWAQGDGKGYTGSNSISDKLKKLASIGTGDTPGTPSGSGKPISLSATPSVRSSTATRASTSTVPTDASTTGPTCPGWDNSDFTDSKGTKYTVSCDYDYYGNDMKDSPKKFASFKECLEACSSLSGCLSVSYGSKSGNCYMKDQIGARVTHKDTWAAAVHGKGTVTAATATTIKTKVISSPTNLPNCPDADKTSWKAASGRIYVVLCGLDSSQTQLVGQPKYNVKTLQDCVQECDNRSTTGCTSVAYVNDACYPKQDIQKLIISAENKNNNAVKIAVLKEHYEATVKLVPSEQ